MPVGSVDLPNLVAVPKNVADRTVVTVARLLHGFSVALCQDVLLLDESATGSCQLVDSVEFHARP